MADSRMAWIDLGDGRSVFRPIKTAEPKRSALSSPMVITDAMTPVQSMLDGKMYDSKRALRATYKRAGVTEVGDDKSVTAPKPFKMPKPDRKAIKDTVSKAFSRAGLGS